MIQETENNSDAVEGVGGRDDELDVDVDPGKSYLRPDAVGSHQNVRVHLRPILEFHGHPPGRHARQTSAPKGSRKRCGALE